MDAQAHQPGEELADFTEEELLSLIDPASAGAYSEIYRRYVDDAVARASSSRSDADARKSEIADAREIADDAFLSVLRSLLNGTADTSDGLQSMVDDAIDERLADPESANGLPVQDTSAGGASAKDTGEPDHALVAQAFSTLPDNWQRILWLREVERLSPEAAADKLNIRAAVVERLSVRAHQDLAKQWARTRPKDTEASVDHRSALIPALLTSPIVIERLSATIAQASPASADAPAFSAGSAEPAPVPVAESATEPVEEPVAESAAEPPAEPAAESAAESESGDADSEEAAAEPQTEEYGAAAMPPAAAVPAATNKGSGPRGSASLAALGTSAAPAQASEGTSSQSAFTMPKPVLIPVIAACIGLLGTLVGLAVVPQHAQHSGFRPGSGATNVSTVDTSTDDDDASRDARSPGDTSSDKSDREPGSENSKASAPAASGQDKNEKTSRNSRDEAGRTDEDPPPEDSPSEDSPDDNGDRPSPKNPGDPGPSDSDRPDPESPSEPTPSEPDDPESPSDPGEPEPPTDDPEPPSDDPTPSEPDEPTSDPSPSESESPSESDPTPEPDPTQDGSSTGPSTPSN